VPIIAVVVEGRNWLTFKQPVSNTIPNPMVATFCLKKHKAVATANAPKPI